MRNCIHHLPTSDIEVFFSFLLGIISWNDIMHIEDTWYNDDMSKIDKDFYKAYKIDMNDEGHKDDCYIHDFQMYWKRYGIKCGTEFDHLLPAVFAPISAIIFWAKNILKMDEYDVNKCKSLKSLGWQSLRQAQGKIESHYRYWADYLYV